MISNYFKLALRNIFKRKGYSLLNIVGLAIGISCCLLIFQHVAFEKSYDKFEDKAEQVDGYLLWQELQLLLSP